MASFGDKGLLNESGLGGLTVSKQMQSQYDHRSPGHGYKDPRFDVGGAHTDYAAYCGTELFPGEAARKLNLQPPPSAATSDAYNPSAVEEAIDAYKAVTDKLLNTTSLIQSLRNRWEKFPKYDTETAWPLIQRFLHAQSRAQFQLCSPNWKPPRPSTLTEEQHQDFLNRILHYEF